MKNVFFCFFLSLIISPFTLIGQQADYDPTKNILPPSPTAAALGKYGDIPVSLNTGTPNITIPIHTLEGKGINVPISLSYHASGVKVDEVSSWVGLGWSLNAGGVVTRTIRGLADEDAKGFKNIGNQVPAPALSLSDFEYIYQTGNGYWDSQPDLFTYNIGGYSGKFTFDNNGNIVTIPHSDIKIVPPTSFQNGHFIITTPDGIQYKLGGAGATEESKTQPNSSGLEPCFRYDFTQKKPTSWYLTEIYNPNTGGIVTFEYTPHTIKYDLAYHEKWTFPLNYHTSCAAGGGEYSNVCLGTDYALCAGISVKRDYGVHLKSIITDYGSVEFICAGDREDLIVLSGEANRLSQIEIRGSNGTAIKKFTLTQDFWEASGQTPSTEPSTSKRMYLKEIVESSGDGSETIPPHVFTYKNGEDLPPRLSFSQDHWGYYNGVAYNEYFTPHSDDIPLHQPLVGNYYNIHFRSHAGDREINADFSDYGILQKIDYPTGGFSEFSFEQHDYGFCEMEEIREDKNLNLSLLWDIPPPPGPKTEMEIINIDVTQSVAINYLVKLIGCSNGAKVSITPVGSNTPVFEIGGYSSSCPETLQGTHWLILDPGDYEVEATVSYGSGALPPNCNCPEYEAGEEASIIIDYTVSLGEELIVNKSAGGVRVKQIITDDKNGSPITRQFEYLKATEGDCTDESSGVLVSEPQYFNINLSSPNNYLSCPASILTALEDAGFFAPPCHYETCYLLNNESSSFKQLTSLTGEHIVYTEVTEILPGNGKTYNEYSYHANSPQTQLLNNMFIPGFPGYDLEDFSTIPEIDVTWKNGNLITQKIFDENGNIIKSLENTYVAVPQDEIRGLIVKKMTTLPCTFMPSGPLPLSIDDFSEYLIFDFKILSEWIQLESSVEILDGVTKTTTYEYDGAGNHTNVVESSFQNSNGEERKTKYFYAPDVYWSMSTEESDAVDEMLLRHMIGVPLRTENYVDGTQASGLWMEYKIEHNLVVPQNYHSYEGGWYKEAEVTDYTPDGLIHKVDKTGWSTETYDWQDGRLTHKNYEEHDQSWDWHFDTHRQLKSATGIDGQKIYYDYDGLLRLETIKARVDVSGTPKITTTYTYNYGLANNGENYVHTHQHFDGFDDQYTKQTFDGLGRDLNTIRIGYSPNGGDVIVNELVYDQYGRIAQKTHLPGSLTSIGYEPSPLNRPTSETLPDGYSVSTSYGNSGNYYKVIVTDENGNPTETITDIIGRTERTIDAKNGETTYDYDKRDNLIQVINPLGQAYDYTYDVHNRLRQKKIPGADCQEFVYDLRDLVIASQDGNLRQKTEDNWIANEYDVYGRVRKTGFYSFPTNTSCTITPGGTPPSIPSNFIPIANKMLTENVYDAYGSGQKPSGCPTGDMDIILKGRLTYTKARVMEEGNLTSTVETGFCYDEYGREIGSEVFASPHGTDKYDHTFDIADHLKSTNRNYSGGVQYTKQYDYDHGGRLAETKFNMGGLGNPNPVTLAKNSYNNRDELIGKALGGALYNVGQNSVFQYLQNVNYSFNVRGFLTDINQMPFKPTSPIPTCETPIPPIPPGNPPNDCAECGDEIVTVQELLKLRWEQNLNVDCYIPCDCELRCDTDCDDGSGGDTTNPDVPTDNPSASELNLPTYLVQIKDCDGDTSLVLADSLINVYGDYSMIGMIELSDDDNQEFRVETTTGDQTVGLDGLLNLIDNGEVTDVKTNNEGDCNECIPDAPECSAQEQVSQNNYINSITNNPPSITYPTLLKRVRLCDGREVYLFEEELINLSGNYLVLQTIEVEHSQQTLTQVLSDGCTTNWTVLGFRGVRTFNSEWNINYYFPCEENKCFEDLGTFYPYSIGNSTAFSSYFGAPPYGDITSIYSGHQNSLEEDGITWDAFASFEGETETEGEWNFNFNIPSDAQIVSFEAYVKLWYRNISGGKLNFGLFDGLDFIVINGNQDYLSLNGAEGDPFTSVTLQLIPDVLPTAAQINQLKVAINHFKASAAIDVVYAKVQYIGACDACEEADPVCTPEELADQQASLDSIEILWNETPLSKLKLPTKLYRVRLCDGSEVYLLQHELDLLEGNYLILQSIDINQLSETHLMKKEGVDGEALDANDLFALKLKYYNGDKQISNTVGQGYGNGNIAVQYWQVGGRDRQAYGYRYDELDRIVFGKYADITEHDVYYNKDHYSVDLFNAYDAIGNINSLSRNGPISECIAPDSSILYEYGNIDRLQYQYNNDRSQLEAVNEYSINRGFKATATYTYDNNGNLITDSGKDITEIKYNHLNLPYEVVFGNGNKIRWMYDATGKKLRKNVIGGNETNEVNYIDGIEKDVLNGDFIYHEEGRVYLTAVLNPDDPSGDPLIPAGTMAYTIKDHLGNARVTFADLDGNGWITIEDNPNTQIEEPQELLQENHYYPFGMNMVGPWYSTEGSSDKYQYNGKELNTEFDLGWNDYGARWYDAAIGRFTGVDPLAEAYSPISPYAYVANNPLSNIDPDGLHIEPVTKKGGGEDGRDLITYKVTGKIINFSNNGVDMETALSDIKTMVETSFQGKNIDGVDINFELDFSIAETMSEVSETDHLIVLANGIDPSIPGGSNGFGGLVSVVDADYFTGLYDKYIGEEGERTAAHELGHLFGLRHESGGGKTSNLMTQGEAYKRGNEINDGQLRIIGREYRAGRLNLGANVYGALPNLGVMNRKFTMTNTKGRGLSREEINRRTIEKFKKK